MQARIFERKSIWVTKGFHERIIGSPIADAFDLRKGGNVARDHTGFEIRDGRAAEHIERSLRPDPAHVIDQQPEKIAFRGTHEPIEHMRVFPNCEVSEDFELRALRRQLVVARKRNEHMITDSADIHDNLRGKRFRQGAVEMVNHGQTASRPALRGARKNGWLAALLGLAGVASAAEPWVLLPEPKFMGHQVTRPIPAAKSTVLAVAQNGIYGLVFARTEGWQKEIITDETLWAETRKSAAEWLKKVTPQYVRNEKKVVRYAVLQSETVPVAATVLAPEFWKQFEEVFGSKMRVVIPSRNVVFILPDLEGDLDAYTPMVMKAWRSGLPKVSLEVFQLTEKGLQAIGAFEEP